MSKNIVVVTGSVRPQSVNEVVVPFVASELEKRGADVSVADLKALNLPFFNAPVPPSSDDFTPTDEGVLTWTRMIAEADGVVFVTPEYNHTLSPVQMNAIDWIYKEWGGKPVALIGYGWTSGATKAHETAREALAVNLKANVMTSQANLYFNKELNPDGTIADQAKVTEAIDPVMTELFDTIG